MWFTYINYFNMIIFRDHFIVLCICPKLGSAMVFYSLHYKEKDYEEFINILKK